MKYTKQIIHKESQTLFETGSDTINDKKVISFALCPSNIVGSASFLFLAISQKK